MQTQCRFRPLHHRLHISEPAAAGEAEVAGALQDILEHSLMHLAINALHAMPVHCVALLGCCACRLTQRLPER
jgi:hypothetical protein